MARIPYSAGEGGSFQALPQGTYDFRILETLQGTSKSGNPQLQIKMEVLDGPNAGKKVSVWYSLLPQSGWKLDALLEALDIEREDTGEVDENGAPVLVFDDEWLVNRCIRFNVTQREWNGRMNNNFEDEAASEFDPEGAPAAAAAPKDTTGDAPPAPAPGPGTMRRRPRPARN